MTGNASTATAVEALRKGAYDYLKKPFEPEELFTSVKNALQQRRLKKDNERVKRKLRDSEAHFRTLFNQASDCIFVVDHTHKDGPLIVDVNEAACTTYGYPFEEFIGKPFSTIDAEDTGESFLEKTHRLLSGERLVFESKHMRKDGTLFPVEVSARMIRIGDTPFFYFIGRNTTERKRAEEALRESEKHLQSVFRAAPTGIGVVIGRVLKQVNKRMCEMTGYAEAELIGRNARMLYTSDEDYEHVGREKYAQIQDHSTGTVETRWKRKDGHIINVLLSSTLINADDPGKGVTFTALDITERKEAQVEQEKLQTLLLQAQKMEAIGTLAGGIAHNFNNVLMAIQGRISLILMDKDISSPDFEHLKCIEDYIKNAAGLTKNLLGFARGGKYEVSPTYLNEFIAHESLMFAQAKKEIQVHEKYGKDLWAVEIDHGQMKQVLMNLFVNAWQAMPEGGDLYIQTENVTLDAAYVKSDNIAPGRYVKISVIDTGAGMDEATRQKIFIPFFTTREMGAGYGLGLASVYGIIRNHGGFINVRSKQGEGTTFNIFLPASNKEVLKKKTLPVELIKGEGTILLVDDEEMIIEVGKKLLEILGYRVLVARSGKEAIEIVKHKNFDIDLVILDMIMPGMGGAETYDRLKEINPGNKVLLSSGYTFDSRAQEMLARGCDGFLRKPFSVEEISQKIRKILDKSQLDKSQTDE
ncbi:MAG: PAS domain S-box protein [Desulfobacterales bacterium]|jgi:PAS domain S-box-containing protein|nr:PAS domain S-box protein [Desulfobacterales bacterium]